MDEQIKLSPLQVVTGVGKSMAMSMLDFILFMVIVVYSAGLTAIPLTVAGSYALTKLGLSAPSFLTVWAGLVSIRLLVRVVKSEV